MNLSKATLFELLVIARYEDREAGQKELRRRIDFGIYEPTENDYLSGLQSSTEEQEEHCEGDRTCL